MEAKIELFKEFWRHNYSYISMELSDDDIQYYIEEYSSISLACNAAADYLLSQGLAEVDE